MIYEVVFLCANNKGRSVAFSEYTAEFLRRERANRIEISSAGIHLDKINQLRKENKDHASKTVTHILKEEGYDVSDHRIQYFGELPVQADLILASDLYTLEDLVIKYPQTASKSFLAGEYVSSHRYKEIHGPYSHKRNHGKPMSEKTGYLMMLHEIEEISKRIAKKLAEEDRQGKLIRRYNEA